MAVPAYINDIESPSIAQLILDIIKRFQLPLPNGCQDLTEVGRSHFLPILEELISTGRPIPFILPAFPFKSPNSVDKVLGVLPDRAEVLALAHLNGICETVSDIYAAGAELHIVSDGLVYNDLLGVSDSTVWEYGEALRQLAKDKEYSRIHFTRLRDLLGQIDGVELTRESYIQNASCFRDQLVEYNLPQHFDAREQIIQDDDTCTTFRGYCKFLMKDLAHDERFAGLSKSAMKKRVEDIGRKMISRGKAFAVAIEKAFPKYVRLSIHPSNGSKKFSISLLNQSNAMSMTPWHGCLRVSLDGSTTVMHKEELLRSDDVELVHEKGVPSYFKEKSDLFDWGDVPITFSNIYPCGLLISTVDDTSIRSVDMSKVKRLAEYNSPVILRGFAETTDRKTFVSKAREMGEIQKWLFGEVLEVKDRGDDTRGLNNVLSAEPMPMHYDGLFKTTTVVDENGEERLVSEAPRFQLFSSIVPAPKGTGFTLFASSRLLLSILPASVPLPQLQSLKWSCTTGGFNGTTIQHIPLIERHPTRDTPCLRYHESWPPARTRFSPTLVALEGTKTPAAGQHIQRVLEDLLYDRSVCLYYGAVQGDVLISDNTAMMHTRTGFAGGSDRESWRIHVD